MSDGLVAALARCQANFPAVPKSRTAKVKMKAGGEYSYTYADLADVLAAVRPVLSAEGIALVQSTDVTDSGVVLVTRLLCGDDSIEGRFPLQVAGQSPQEVGSLLTYFRRYTITSLLGISAQDDDDGQQAQQAHRTPEPAASDEAREFTRTLITTLDDTAKAAVKKWLADKRVPSLTKAGATLTQLNDLADYITELTTEPWPVEGGGEGSAVEQVAPPHPEPEAIPFNPVVAARAHLTGSERQTRNAVTRDIAEDKH